MNETNHVWKASNQSYANQFTECAFDYGEMQSKFNSSETLNWFRFVTAKPAPYVFYKFVFNNCHISLNLEV